MLSEVKVRRVRGSARAPCSGLDPLAMHWALPAQNRDNLAELPLPSPRSCQLPLSLLEAP